MTTALETLLAEVAELDKKATAGPWHSEWRDVEKAVRFVPERFPLRKRYRFRRPHSSRS